MAAGVRVRLAALGTVILVSCGPAKPEAADVEEAPVTAGPGSQAYVWPAGLVVLGDGYPDPGDPCRRLGETELTVNYLDDSAQLVGCPGAAGDGPAAGIVAAGGRVVGTVKGVTLLSIPQGDANAGMAAAPDGAR